MSDRLDGAALRDRLREARVMLLFTPELCGERDPLEALEAALPWVDLIQVRPKPAGAGASRICTARDARDWTLRVLDALSPEEAERVPVLVDDRPDVAAVLAGRGVAGVHLGQSDAPPRSARELLGPEALIGLSTRDSSQVARATVEPVDYLGFGPIHATATKGYERGQGADRAWIACAASAVPVFAIGGIAPDNVDELGRVGRVAVGSAVLAAEDPAAAARTLRGLLESALEE